MDKDYERIWRLELPDDWTPTGYWCVQITIPGDEQYFDALTAALGLLTIPKTFARDATQTGAATVAKTWAAALYLAPFSVQQDCIVAAVPPIPDQAAADDQAAAIIQLFFQSIVSELNTCAVTAGACSGCVDSIMTELIPYGQGDALRGALSRLCADLNNLTTEQRADYEHDCPYVPLFNDLRTKIKDNPFDWLNHLSDWLFGWLNSTADAVISDLSITAGLLGGGAMANFVTDHGGAGGGATFGGDCAWSVDLDFRVSQHAFEVFHESRTYCPPTIMAGVWVEGVGFQGVQTHNDSCALVDEQCFAIRVASFHATKVSLTGHWDYVSGASSDFGIGSDIDLVHITPVVGDNVATWTGDADLTYLFLVGAQGVSPSPPNITHQSLHIEGIGHNPFA